MRIRCLAEDESYQLHSQGFKPDPISQQICYTCQFENHVCMSFFTAIFPCWIVYNLIFSYVSFFLVVQRHSSVNLYDKFCYPHKSRKKKREGNKVVRGGDLRVMM